LCTKARHSAIRAPVRRRRACTSLGDVGPARRDRLKPTRLGRQSIVCHQKPLALGRKRPRSRTFIDAEAARLGLLTTPIRLKSVSSLCRVVCTQIAVEMDPDAEVSADERLTPRTALRG
jgi:hypothetical protein